MRLASFVVGLVLLLAPWPAGAQLGPGPGGRAPFSAQSPAQNEAGRFDYYSLVLSWSPSFCATQSGRGNGAQCNRRDGRHFAFVLHGLWPQHERGWPEHCPIRDSTFVPQPVVDRMLDIMPSQRLVVHQFRKHGTCSGLDAEAYFELSRKLFESIKVPQRFARPNQAFTVSPPEVIQAFVEANAGMRPDQLAVVCGGAGQRLREVRICFTRDRGLRSCGANESPRRLCSSDRLYVPPVREGEGGLR